MLNQRQKTVQELARQLRRLERKGDAPAASDQLVQTGTVCDQFFSSQGIRRGSLLEFLVAGEGHGASWLLLRIAAAALRSAGKLIILDRNSECFPPAVQRTGIVLERVVFVRAPDRKETTWAWEQALRCSGVSAVVGQLDQIDSRTYRRFQLATELGGTIGCLIRPERFREEPAWAHARLLVRPLPVSSSWSTGRRLQIESLDAHRPRVQLLEIDDETGGMHLVSELARSEAAQCSARA